MKMTKTPVKVALSDVTVDMNRNVREKDGYEIQNLLEDLVFRGQQDPCTLERAADGKIYPLKGFRRCMALQTAAQAGLIDPHTGKKFEYVLAFVAEELTERERIELLLDHGQRRGLNRIELQHAAERAFEALYTEKEVVTILRDLFQIHYPPTKTVVQDSDSEAEKAKKYLDYYRGVVQTLKKAWSAPTVLHDAWMNKLRGKQKWPNKAELFELVKVFEQECDKAPQYSKKSPGPLFMERWDKYLAAQAEAASNGEARAKSQSMMNRQQCEDAGKVCESMILKIAFKLVTRDLSPDKLPEFDKLVNSIPIPDDVKAKLIALIQ